MISERMDLFKMMMLMTLMLMSLSLSSSMIDKDGFISLDPDTLYIFPKVEEFFRINVMLCQSRGGKIWIPRSHQEITYVLTALGVKEFDEISVGIYKDANISKVFQDLDGRVDFYRNWEEKDQSVFYDYDDVSAVVTKSGEYIVRNYGQRHRTICMKRKQDASNEDDSTGYTLLKEFKSMYKLYSNQDDIPNANLKCLSDRATLLVPESAQEIEAVFNSVVPKKYDQVLIGVQNYFRNGFRTIYERSNFYANWLDGYPKDEHFDAVALRNGSYQSGDMYKPFVCKKISKV